MADFRDRPAIHRLLSGHRVRSSDWHEMRQVGFSGARIYRQPADGGRGYVLKVTSAATDWIMRATSDLQCREAALANTRPLCGDGVGSPVVGSAQDGEVFAILMRDVSPYLLPNEGLTHEQAHAVIRGLTRLHASTPPDGRDIGWCTVRDRLTLFAPDAQKLNGFRIAGDILRGWELFFEHAPKGVAGPVRSLFDDSDPVERALARLPHTLVHGDLKLDNIALLPDASLSLIDWSMTMAAPAAVDLGWFLAMNSRALPFSLDAAMTAYGSPPAMSDSLRELHWAMTVLCGLLIRGWRKALDASSGDPAEFRWWCQRGSAALQML